VKKKGESIFVSNAVKFTKDHCLVEHSQTLLVCPSDNNNVYVKVSKKQTYRVIKKSFCTGWLQYRKLQVMFEVPPPVSRHLLTHRTVFSKTVFSIAWSTFRMYSMMAIFNSSIVWGLFEYTEFFIAPQRKKSGRERSRDLGGKMVLEIILSASVIPNSNYVIVVGDW